MASIDNDELRLCGCDWSSPVAEDIREILDSGGSGSIPDSPANGPQIDAAATAPAGECQRIAEGLGDGSAPIDDQRLRDALTQAGFTLVGRRPGSYTRWQWPGSGSRSASLMVPEQPEMADYADLIEDSLATLSIAADRGSRAQAVLTALGHFRPSADSSTEETQP